MREPEPWPEEIIVRLTSDEALVLFEWLHEHASRPGDSLPITDASERVALWNLSAALESVLVAPLQDDYHRLIEEARDRLRQQ